MASAGAPILGDVTQAPVIVPGETVSGADAELADDRYVSAGVRVRREPGARFVGGAFELTGARFRTTELADVVVVGGDQFGRPVAM